MRIASYVHDSIVDGPGLRLTVFVQGCPHRCPGCHNPQTHDFAGGKALSVAELVRQMDENTLLDGLTLSGGEPFAQAEDCAALARAARERGLNVWCYSGWTLEELLRDQRPGVRELLELTDVLVDGPFLLEERSLALKWRGSANQRVLDLPKSLAAGEAVLWDAPAYI